MQFPSRHICRSERWKFSSGLAFLSVPDSARSGYFQRQFETFTGNPWIALFLQAVLFGIAHGYQGIEACAKIACFGVLYGLLALWRKSLRPGMMAHAWSDILSGIFGI